MGTVTDTFSCSFVALRQTYISLQEMMWHDGPDAADTELLGRLRIDNRSTIVAPFTGWPWTTSPFTGR